MMENRRLILLIALGMGLILLYIQGIAWLDRHHPGWAGQPPATQPAAAAPAPATSTPALATNSSSQPSATASSATAPTIAAAAPNGQALIVPATQPSGGAASAAPAPVSLGSAAVNDSQFALELNVEPRGAGVRSVILNQFKSSAHNGDEYVFEQPPKLRADVVPLASRSIRIDGV